jgi:hypothetical protein
MLEFDMPHGTSGQFLRAAHVPAHRARPDRPLQTPRPATPDSLPDPDAYFCPTLTEATTAPDGATRPRNVRILGCVMFPFTTSTMKLYVGSQSPRSVTKTRFHVPSKRVPAKAGRKTKKSDPARARHTISALARSLRTGGVDKSLLLMMVVFAAMPVRKAGGVWLVSL